MHSVASSCLQLTSLVAMDAVVSFMQSTIGAPVPLGPWTLIFGQMTYWQLVTTWGVLAYATISVGSARPSLSLSC